MYEFFLADLRQLRLLEVGRRAGGGRRVRAQPLRRVGKEQSSAGGGLEPNRAGRGAMLRGRGEIQRGRAQHLSPLGSETSQLLVRRVMLLLTTTKCRSCWINILHTGIDH